MLPALPAESAQMGSCGGSFVFSSCGSRAKLRFAFCLPEKKKLSKEITFLGKSLANVVARHEERVEELSAT